MVCIASSKSCKPKRFVSCSNKVERKYTQEQKPSQFHCYNQNMGFVNRIDQKVAKHRIGIQMKKWWWSPFVWMMDVVLQGSWVLYCHNKEEGDESLPLLAFWIGIANTIFLKYSKEGRLSSIPVVIRNISWNVCYDWQHKILLEPTGTQASS